MCTAYSCYSQMAKSANSAHSIYFIIHIYFVYTMIEDETKPPSWYSRLRVTNVSFFSCLILKTLLHITDWKSLLFSTCSGMSFVKPFLMICSCAGGLFGVACLFSLYIALLYDEGITTTGVLAWTMAISWYFGGSS